MTPNFNPQPISPKLNNIGKYQKYTLRQMAKRNCVVRVVMYHHQEKVPDHIHLFDEQSQKMLGGIYANELQAMGRRGLFTQEVSLNGTNVSIIKFRLKPEVQNYFTN